MEVVSINRPEMLRKLRRAREAHKEVLAERTGAIRLELLKLVKETVQRLSNPDWSPDAAPDWVGGVGIVARTSTRANTIPKNMIGLFDAMITYLEVRACVQIDVSSGVFTQCLELFAVPGGPESIHGEIEKRVSEVAKLAGVCGSAEVEHGLTSK